MEIKKRPSVELSEPCYLEAAALSRSIVAIRRAQGKAVPSDFVDDSSEWHLAALDFANDILRVLDA